MGNPRILLVEDEQLARNLAERALARAKIQVVLAVDGQEGLRKFREEGPFDVVVTDLGMPVMDGPTMIEHIKGEDPGVKLVVLSAANTGAQHAAAERLAQLGVRVFAKPCDYQALGVWIHELSK